MTMSPLLPPPKRQKVLADESPLESKLPHSPGPPLPQMLESPTDNKVKIEHDDMAQALPTNPEQNEAAGPQRPGSGDAPKKKNLRRKHRNSHLGCGTCKKRRIKCDENLPACHNCLKGKLHCAYLNMDVTQRNQLRMAQYNQLLRQEKLDAAHVVAVQAVNIQQPLPKATSPKMAIAPYPQPVPVTYIPGKTVPVSQPILVSTPYGPAPLIPQAAPVPIGVMPQIARQPQPMAIPSQPGVIYMPMMQAPVQPPPLPGLMLNGENKVRLPPIQVRDDQPVKVSSMLH